MAIMSRDQVLAHIAAGRHQTWNFSKDGATHTPEAAGNWYSCSVDPGSPGAMVDPTTYANCTDLAGSIFHTNVSPAKRYMHAVYATASQNGTLMIYDRLGHIGSIALSSTGNKTVSSSALPRSMDTVDLANVEAWLEITTATTTTAVVCSMNSYTNEAGTPARAGGNLTFPATATNTRWMGKLPLQAGDKGVQAVSTINVGTAASAGVANVVLLRPIAYVPIIANIITPLELPELPRIYDGSSLMLAFLATTTTAVDIWGRTVCVYDS